MIGERASASTWLERKQKQGRFLGLASVSQGLAGGWPFRCRDRLLKGNTPSEIRYRRKWHQSTTASPDFSAAFGRDAPSCGQKLARKSTSAWFDREGRGDFPEHHWQEDYREDGVNASSRGIIPQRLNTSARKCCSSCGF